MRLKTRMGRCAVTAGVWMVASLSACGGDGDTGDSKNNNPGDTPQTVKKASPGECAKTIGKDVPVCCTPDVDEQKVIDEVLKLLNDHRKKNGRGALLRDDGLQQAMQGHVRHMVDANFFSHTAPVAELAQFNTRASLCGAKAFGENIAAGQRSAEQVMNSWINSDGHNRNMLDGTYTKVGIGFRNNYWGQIFGR